MKIKTSDLIGLPLNWAVDRALGDEVDCLGPLDYSTDWSHGGPIIERKGIFLAKSVLGHWVASIYDDNCETVGYEDGPTPLIAAMRCFVDSELGHEIEFPFELML